jgi:hypothetical protein
MEEMENNPNMSEAQKQQMREMMGGAKSMMDNAASAPEAGIARRSFSPWREQVTYRRP